MKLRSKSGSIKKDFSSRILTSEYFLNICLEFLSCGILVVY